MSYILSTCLNMEPFVVKMVKRAGVQFCSATYMLSSFTQPKVSFIWLANQRMLPSNIFIRSLRTLYDLDYLHSHPLLPDPLSLPYPTHPTSWPLFFFFLKASSPICAIHALLGVGPPAAAYLTYSGPHPQRNLTLPLFESIIGNNSSSRCGTSSPPVPCTLEFCPF